MRIDILTLFPDMFDIFNKSIIGRAKERGVFQINALNIRDFTADRHKSVDDSPYGGGSGMVMTPQPIFAAIDHLKMENPGKVIFLGPKGKVFDQRMAEELSKEEGLIFLCGHYEGIDERIHTKIDMEVSLGDFILTGGEMAAIPIIDSILRLLPDVLGKEDSSLIESFSENLLEYPHYTRPETYEGMKVPEILLSGHHEKIRIWRRYMMLKETREKRPDLYRRHILTKEDRKILKKFEEHDNL